MVFLVFAHPNFNAAGVKLVNDIIHTGNEAQLVLHSPTVNDILNAQNEHRRVLIIGAHEVETGTISERMGSLTQSHYRAPFLAELAAPAPPIAME